MSLGNERGAAPAAVHDHDFAAVSGKVDGGCQAGGAAPNDQAVDVVRPGRTHARYFQNQAGFKAKPAPQRYVGNCSYRADGMTIRLP